MYHLRPVVTSPNTEGTSHLPKRAAVSTASRAVLLPLGDLVTKQTRRRLLVPTLVNISGDPQTFNSTKHGGGAHQNGLPRQCCAPVPLRCVTAGGEVNLQNRRRVRANLHSTLSCNTAFFYELSTEAGRQLHCH